MSFLVTCLLQALHLQSERFASTAILHSAITKIDQLVADVLLGKADAITNDIITAAPAPLGSDACKQDTCCIWKYVADDMLTQFKGQSSRCNNNARVSPIPVLLQNFADDTVRRALFASDFMMLLPGKKELLMGAPTAPFF